MKSIFVLACLLVVVTISHASNWGGYGYGAPVAVVKPVLSGPVVSGWGQGWGGYGLGRGWGGYGLGRSWGDYGSSRGGWGGYGWGNRGWNWGGRGWGNHWGSF